MTIADPLLAQRTLHAPRPGARALTADLLWKLPRVGRPVLSAGGGEAVVPVTTYDVEKNKGCTRLYRLQRDGQCAPLTAAERSAGTPAFSPDGSQLAFLAKDRDADPKDRASTQVWVLPLGGGEARCVTDLPLGAVDVLWMPDGKRLLVGAWLFKDHPTVEGSRSEASRRKDEPITTHATEERFFRYWDRWLSENLRAHIFLVDLGSNATRDLLPESSVWFSFMEPAGAIAVAPDGSELAFSAQRVGGPGMRLRSDVYRLALPGGDATPQPLCLTGDHPGSCSRPRYSPDGSQLLYGRREDPDFYADRVRLWTYDLRQRRHAPLLVDWDRSPESFEYGSDGTLLLEADDAGRGRLFRLRPGDTEPVALTDQGHCGQATQAPDGTIWFTRQDLSSPPEVYLLAPAGSAPTRLTQFTAQELAEVALGEVRELRLEGSHGEEIQCLVVLPPGFKEGAPRPLVHLIHGGPHGIFGDQWHWRWSAQAFAARGAVVACVNFQGSTSFGNDFAQRIQGAWADRPTGDIMAATDALLALGWVDEARMGIAGGSYGGYLTAWLTTQTQRFACAVNHAGVFDLSLMYASDVTWGRATNIGADLWVDASTMDRNNPARHTAGMQTPMLVVHGERDYRVPIDQALLCYGILKAKDVPARLLYFSDENHWILKPKNSLRWYQEVLDWLDRFLGPKA